MSEILPIKPNDFTPSVIFYLWVFVLSLVVRAVISVFKAWMLAISEKLNGCPFKNFWDVFLDKNILIKIKEKDYFLPFLIGFLEMSFCPYLMSIQRWDAIGAWLSLKTVAQFTRWGKDRNVFQRFLLGNILILLFSFFILSRFFVKS